MTPELWHVSLFRGCTVNLIGEFLILALSFLLNFTGKETCAVIYRSIARAFDNSWFQHALQCYYIYMHCVGLIFWVTAQHLKEMGWRGRKILKKPRYLFSTSVFISILLEPLKYWSETVSILLFWAWLDYFHFFYSEMITRIRLVKKDSWYLK